MKCLTRSLLAGLLLVAGTSWGWSQSADFESLAGLAGGSVVTILGYDVGRPEPKSQGTGFYVQPDIVATNHHVIQGSALIEVRGDMAAAPVRVLRILTSDPAADVALLEVEETGVPLPLATRPPSPGEDIMVISSPLGLEKTVSRGVVSGLREIEGRVVCQISAPVSKGSSGGPILDREGVVLGMTSFTVGEQQAQNLNFGVLSTSILHLLDSSQKSVNTRLRITTGDHGEIVIME